MKTLGHFAVGLLLAAFGGNAVAQDVAGYKSASEEFQSLVTAAQSAHAMPRGIDPKVAPIIATLSDHHRFLESQQYEMKDLGTLMEICSGATQAMMSYALFDPGSQIGADKDSAKAAAHLAQLMDRNFITYQDELFQLYPFVVRCSARQIPLLTRFAQSLKPEEFTDVRRAGLEQARKGMQQTLTGMLMELGNPKIRLDNKRAALQALTETAEAFASVLKADARAQIQSVAKSAAVSAPAELRAGIEKMAKAMGGTECTGLCAI